MRRLRFLYFFYPFAALFLFFFLSYHIPLWSSDEGRFGELAREMLESGNFIVPHFNYVPYLEKPVLAPWLTAFFYLLFGVHSLSTRLVPILSALAGLAVVYHFGKKLFDARTAAYAALILLTSAGYVLVGRFAVIDMLMTLLLSLTLFCLLTGYLSHQTPSPSGRGQGEGSFYYLAAYFLMGLAFLTKGLIGIVLPGAIFFLFLIWTKNLSELKRMRLGWGILILAAVILPWFIAISKQEPEFFNEFILKQHFNRFATGSFGRKKPFWFFIPIFFVTALPWTLFFPSAVSRVLKELKEKPQIKFLLVWMAVIFVFFSIPKSKLPYYLLPMSMPLALLTGHYFSQIETLRPGDPALKRIWRVLAVFSAAAAVIADIVLIFIRHEKVMLLRPLLFSGSIVLAGGMFASWRFLEKEKIKQAVVSMAGAFYALLILTIAGMKVISPFQSTASAVEILKPLLWTDDIVAVYASPDQFSDLGFHLKRRILIAGSDRGTLEHQSRELERHVQDRYFLGLEEFVPLFNNKTRRVFCLMEEEKFHDLTEGQSRDYLRAKGIELSQYRILSREYGKILIANH